jgi:hypothetical protein
MALRSQCCVMERNTNSIFGYNILYTLFEHTHILFLLLNLFHISVKSDLGFRDALLACFPGVQHLMCFFHVKQACQVKLRGKPMKD